MDMEIVRYKSKANRNCKLTRQQAFTAVEILVAVGIVGLLSVIAVRTYEFYTIRNRIMQVIPVLETAKQAIILNYQLNNTWPDPFSIYGGTFSAVGGTYNITINNGVVKTMHYNYGGTDFWICISMDSSLGIPGMTSPVNGNDGLSNRICMRTRVGANGFRTGCGIWYNGAYGDGADVPLAYLTPGCNCGTLGTDMTLCTGAVT